MEVVFNIWPSLREMADELGEKYPTVASWKRRNSVPASYDFKIISAAKKRGKNLTFEDLARLRHQDPSLPASADPQREPEPVTDNPASPTRHAWARSCEE